MIETQQTKIFKFHQSKIDEINDVVTIEEPLEIKLIFEKDKEHIVKNLSITMRTPGQDAELATGFLFTEGLIKSYNEIQNVDSVSYGVNSVAVTLSFASAFDFSKLERHFYTSSSCGVCGKTSIDAVNTVLPESNLQSEWSLNPELIYCLPDKLRAAQEVFESTGGLHASALFNLSGELSFLREDVGRHNALDKVIGAALEKDLIPLHEHILLLSGRASFELLQKSAMAGIKMVLAVGAPSNLAVQMAENAGITLVGFLRNERFNLYTNPQRIKFEK